MKHYYATSDLPYFVPGSIFTILATWIVVRSYSKVPIESKFMAIGIIVWFYGIGAWFFVIQFNYLKEIQLLILGYFHIIVTIWYVLGIIIKKIITNRIKKKTEKNTK